MAAGDLLYIVAFIVLPTAVLVSCIWALVLLRNGTLLPARPQPRDDPAEYGQVEDTGEHQVIQPSVAASDTAADSVPTGTQPVAVDPVLVTSPDHPPIQSTEEFQIVAMETPAGSSPPVVAELPEVPSASADAHQNGSVSTVRAQATENINEDASLMIVPLDDGARELGSAMPKTAPQREHAESSQIGESNGIAHSTATSAHSPRRPTRHLTPSRTADGPGAAPRPRTGQRRATHRPDGDR